MEQIWAFKIIHALIVTTYICLTCGCSGDDSCGYEVVGCVKNATDSTLLGNVSVTSIAYNYGDKETGKGSSIFYTNQEGKFTYESWLTPQGAYNCPSASEIELQFRYEKSGFATIDTLFEKGTIIDGGTGERGKNILTLPTIYLKSL